MTDKRVFHQLSEPQKSIWYLEKAYPGTSLNIVAGTLRLRGDVSYPSLEKALNIFVKKNDSMRLRLCEVDGNAMQYVTEYSEFKPDFFDFSRGGGLKDLFAWDEETTRTPFNIIENQLFYCALFKVSDEESGFYMKMHHLISDAWTMGLLIRQVISLYSKIKKGEPVDESPNPSYIEHLNKNEEYEKSGRFENDKIYWNKKFETLPEMTVLKPQKSNQISINAKRKTLVTPLKLSNKIREFCSVNNLSPFTLFMSALSIYINRVTGIEDIILGTTILNRINKREKETTGMFVSVAAPVRISISDTMDFRTFAKEMLRESTDVLRHQKYSYNYLISDLKKTHKFSNKLFDIVLSYQNSKVHKNETEEDYVCKWLFSGYQVESLVISVNDREDGGNLIIDYDFLTDVFNIKEIEFIHQHIISLLWHALDNPSREISKLEMISEKEKRTILQEFNNTYANYPREMTVNQLFEEQASRTPDNTAIVFQDKTMTYRELNERANALAHRLRDCGIGPNVIVGLMVRRSFEMLIGIIGVLKAGGAYLPIDPDYPGERKAYMLENSGAKVLLSKREPDSDTVFDGTVIDLYDKASYAPDFENPDNKNKSSDMSYIIYTSGSTGKPKGTMIPHRAVANYCFKDRHNVLDFVIADDLKRIVSVTTISFDIFVTESLLPLLNGMTVILADETEQNRQDKLNTLIIRHKAEVIQTTPSKMSLLVSDNDYLEYLKALKVIILGGEPLSRSFLKKLKSMTNARIFNAYGPTETTVWSTISDLQSETVMIGRPIANTQIYILDRNLNLLPIGIPGDIYIAGEGISSGYFNNSALTDERFIYNRFMNYGKMYKTGDVGYWKSKGEIVYIGRNDYQIKLRGYRIELGEIESQLMAHGSIKSVVVNGIDEAGSTTYLCAYIIPENHYDEQQVRQYLKKRLPDYMIPSCFVILNEFPYTSNGKVNRNALPIPDFKRSADSGYEPPKNEQEAKLVKIWSDILDSNDIGVLDDYIAVGGDSLKAIKIVTEIKRRFGVDMSPRDVFQLNTIREQAEFIASASDSGVSSTGIMKAPLRTHYPLSSAQKRMFILSDNGAGIGINMTGGFIIEGKLDLDRISDAFGVIIKRHESLRTSFELRDGGPVQIIHETVDFCVEQYDSDGEDFDALMDHFVRPFSLSTAPLFRLGLARVNEKKHLLMIDMHHIISDGTSLNVMINEFIVLYYGGSVPELKFQYKDYAIWHNALLKSQNIEKQKDYWLSVFNEKTPDKYIKLDFQRPVGLSYNGDKHYFVIDQPLTTKIKRLASDKNATLYMVMLTALKLLLFRMTGLEDLVICMPIEGRLSHELHDLIGMFANILLIRSHPTADKTFDTYLREIKQIVLEAYENQDCPVDEVVDNLIRKWNLSRDSMLDITFVLTNLELPKMSTQDFSAWPYKYNNKRSLRDLKLDANDMGNIITCTVEYNTDVLKTETIQALFADYITVLEKITENPVAKIGEFKLTPPPERKPRRRGASA